MFLESQLKLILQTNKYLFPGHLESDEKRLTAKLCRSPDLQQPITEAQVLIN